MLLQKLVGEFLFDFSQGNLEENSVGNLEGIFRGFFLTHRTKAQKIRGKFRSIFRTKIRASKKIFRAKFTLQTCHLNDFRHIKRYAVEIAALSPCMNRYRNKPGPSNILAKTFILRAFLVIFGEIPVRRVLGVEIVTHWSVGTSCPI